VVKQTLVATAEDKVTLADAVIVPAAGEKLTAPAVAVYAAWATAESALLAPVQPIALTITACVKEGLLLASYVIPALHVPLLVKQLGALPSVV